MAERIFVVTGLGYGDEGKGKTAHWLCSRHKAHTVVRTGGPQALHRVVTASGTEHVHAQFGSGTLSGAATHLSKNMVIDPYAIIAEGRALEDELGIRGVFSGLTIHEDALVITPFQAIANRLRELTRGDARYGSVGVGVGETVLDAEFFGEYAIRAGDLGKPHCVDKLEAVRKRKLRELEEIISRIGSLPKQARDRARLEVENLNRDGTVEWAVGWFSKLASMVNIVDTGYVAEKILGRSGTVVFEGSQGVLLDRWFGFHPYTTKVRTIPETALSLIRESGYDGKVTSLGVLRAYHTRHGAGPFVAECPELTRQLPDAANSNHPWQGSFRVGSFDIVAAKYAIAVCGGTKALDGLVVTCADRIESLGTWELARSYNSSREARDTGFFSKNDAGRIDGIMVSRELGALQLKRQEELGRLLYGCSPDRTTLKTEGDAASLCSGVLNDELDIPVVAVSVGPTEKDCVELISIKNGQYR
ncbi:MAG: adenylosuccinate synthetase [bacterium]|nr:adenylosuccinate synthetase [bacterium]